QDELDPRPAASAVWRLGVDLEHDAALLELRDQGGNRGAGEPGGAGDVGLAGAAVRAKHAHDTLPISLSEPRERPVASARRFPPGHARSESWPHPGVCQDLEHGVGRTYQSLDKLPGVSNALAGRNVRQG